MKKKIILAIGIIFVMIISGCGQEEITCEEPYSMIGTTCCLDANGNGVCDSQEVEVTVTQPEKEPEVEEEPEEEPIDSRVKEMLDKAKEIDSYSYEYNRFEGGSTVNRVSETFEVWRSGDSMKQVFSTKVYYKTEDGTYEYARNRNESYPVGAHLLKSDNFLTEMDGAKDIEVVDHSFGCQERQCMKISYTKGNNYYEITFWKYHGVPLRVEINNQDDKGTIINYDRIDIGIDAEEAELPDSEIITT